MTESQTVRAEEGAPRALTNPACFVCGAANQRGLRIRFHSNGEGVHAQWTPSPEWEGFRGIVHGGVLSTVLDEAMSKAIAQTGCEALTAELRVRFRKPVNSWEDLSVRGWVRSRKRRRIETEATLSGADGVEFAHAWATFLELPVPADLPTGNGHGSA